MQHPGNFNRSLSFGVLCLIVLLGTTATLSSSFNQPEDKEPKENHQVYVPLGGNTWCSASGLSGGKISDQGIVDWTNQDVIFTTYVRLTKPGSLKVWLHGDVPEGKSPMSFS